MNKVVASRYKDQCDICKKFAYCKGCNGKVLCEECQKNEGEIKICQEKK